MKGLDGGPRFDAVVLVPRLTCGMQHSSAFRMLIMTAYEQFRRGCIASLPVKQAVLLHASNAGHPRLERPLL